MTLHPVSQRSPTTAGERSFRVLAISGSLRAKSSNTSLLRALIALAEQIDSSIQITLYDRLAVLPYFNPDLDLDEQLPPVVRDFRTLIGEVDAVVICSPEYAHGMPGVLKNGLDWLVGSIEFPGKPVALLNASTRSTHAYAALIEVLTTMSARIVAKASLTIPIANNRVDETAMLEDPEVAERLHVVLEALVADRIERLEAEHSTADEI